MIDYDVLLVSTESDTQIVATQDESVLLVAAYTQTELTVPLESYQIIDVALQGIPGPKGPPGDVGPTLFTDIAAIELSTINSRLAVLDQFSASLTNTTESSDFATVYQLHI